MLLRTLCLSPHLVEKIHTCRHYACYGNKEYLSQAIRDVPATWLASWREPGVPNPRTWVDGTLHVCEPLSMLAFPVTVCKKKSNKSYAWTLLNVIPPPTLLTSRSLYSRISSTGVQFGSNVPAKKAFISYVHDWLPRHLCDLDWSWLLIRFVLLQLKSKWFNLWNSRILTGAWKEKQPSAQTLSAAAAALGVT